MVKMVGDRLRVPEVKTWVERAVIGLSVSAQMT